MAIITRETDYALRVLAELAAGDSCRSVRALAQETDVPELFLRKIMQRLQQAGLVVSRQGPFGGYRLAADADRLSVLDVLTAVQGPLAVNACFEQPGICSQSERCPFRDKLAELQSCVNGRLAQIRLSDVGQIVRRRRDDAASN